MTEAEITWLRAKRAAAAAEVAEYDAVLGASNDDRPAPKPRRRSARRVQRIVPPSEEELAEVTPMEEARVERAARRKGVL